MRKDFKNLDRYAAFQPVNCAEWQKANGIHADWKTPEHIEVKPVYTKDVYKRQVLVRADVIAGDIYLDASFGVLQFDERCFTHDTAAHDTSGNGHLARLCIVVEFSLSLIHIFHFVCIVPLSIPPIYQILPSPHS